MDKQVEFTGEIVLDDWRVNARYAHPDIFELTIFQNEEGAEDVISVGLKMTKAQFTDLRNFLKAVDCAEQVII